MALHHPKIQKWKIILETYLRDITFGVEDGIVSTFGVLIGVTIGAKDIRFVQLTGIIVIMVEALSMAVGNFLSARSEKDRVEKILQEELEEIRNDPEKERLELIQFYTKQGFSTEQATQMAATIMKDERVILEEMAHHELKVFPDKPHFPLKNALMMWASYAVGGLIPLFPYFLLPLKEASFLSIACSMTGLFALGVLLAHFSLKRWWRSGLETLALSLISGGIGFGVGWAARQYLGLNS